MRVLPRDYTRWDGMRAFVLWHFVWHVCVRAAGRAWHFGTWHGWGWFLVWLVLQFTGTVGDIFGCDVSDNAATTMVL